MSNRIKYIFHPAYLESAWIQRNPLLGDGEIAFIKDSTGKTINSKVGPGLFNDLPYFSGGKYPYVDIVSNEIGDAKGSLYGKTTAEILNLMLNPYQVPVVSGSRNNGSVIGGPFSNVQIKEIGISIINPVLIAFNISNAVNLLGGTPIEVDSGGIFNDGMFANGQISLTPQMTLNPTLISSYDINIRAAHSKGFTNTDKTTIKFLPRIIWGSSELADLSMGSDVNALLSKGTILGDNFNKDYQFSRQGYHWLAIPGMLSPNNPKFTDVTDPNAPGNVAFVSKGSMLVDNGVGVYVYQLYRSPFYITESISKYRVVNG